ncbi:hypothetical protein VJ923_02950 [Adlercreutzia sp. R25]|uniref:hypothetical protein n=1 Tax=Adlercreutzia shanghongiae TaxID=3111773 RepID=UPI002DBFAEFC|nr:hypothetical protein [Adlercreutzia sp. R25]MEC4272116.1 hypothetical protein [Adlercreutzia sp. R25]
MALLRPSLTLVLDLDERSAAKQTILEINRSYAHIGTPVIRTHAPESEDAPVRNTARAIVNMGTYSYLNSADEGADERWDTIVGPWIGNLLHKVGNNMKVFNDRQRKIGNPEVHFETLNIELGAGAFIVAVHPQGAGAIDPAVAELVTAARTLRNDGTFAEAVRVEMPTATAWTEQRDAAWDAWIVEHPEALEEPEEEDVEEVIEETPKTREELLAEDIIAKSYENTAVPPTDSPTLPKPEREVEDEEDPFDFAVDYTLWTVVDANGAERTYDSAAAAFVD